VESEYRDFHKFHTDAKITGVGTEPAAK